MQKYDAAAEAFAIAVNASKGVPLYLGNMSEALRLAGKHDLAIKGFTKALDAWKPLEVSGVKFSPVKIADDLAGRAQSRIALKQYKEAIDDLTKALDLTDRKIASYFLTRAAAYEGLGEETAAEADRKAAESLSAKVTKPAHQQLKTENTLVGTWTGTYTANGMRVTEVIALNADGTFFATITLANAFGTERILEAGTWSVTKTRLTVNGKKLGVVSRPYELSGDEVKVGIQELGITATFSRMK
jgi:tetratricopeptide (TPR) repeat protein